MTIPSVQKTGRLLSLDVFRGATIAGMMLVNNPGDWKYIYPPFGHAAWNGWTYTDTIFPFFLWIVGVAMTFSFAKRKEKGDDLGKLGWHVVRRAAIIFLVGLFLSGVPFGLLFGHQFSFSTIRIPGVLQRIAVCYLISGLIVLNTGWKAQAWATASFLAVYWIAVLIIPVPGYGAGVLEPTGNLCWYLDSTLLAGHTWAGAPVPGFDPEGIFSTLPAVATTLFGVLTGQLLRSEKSHDEKLIRMFVYGNILMLAGIIMDNWLPINKNLWTSSYAIFMAGLANNVLGVLFWVIDIRGIHRWSKPLAIYGLNAITMFFLAGFFGRMTAMIKFSTDTGGLISLKSWYYQTFFVPLGPPMVTSLLHSLFYVLVLYGIAYVMYKRNWIVKV